MHAESTPHESSTGHTGAEPTFGDLLRFLWARRVRLLSSFLFLAGVSVVGLLLWHFVISRPVVEGTLDLKFRGIERHEYPSGKKFSIEDIRSPQVLAHARTNAGLPSGTAIQDLYVGVEIVPIIPAEVQARWQKQDRDGSRREEFLSHEFRLRVHPKGLTKDQSVPLLTALVKAYQDEVKFEQESALRRVADLSTLNPAELAQKIDPWDLPTLLRERETAFQRQLDALIAESRDFRDAKFRISFRDVGSDLATWDETQLAALTAFTYGSHLVRDRDLMIKRLGRRIEELNIQLKQLNGEAEQATTLVESLDRSKPLLAGALTGRDGSPLIDASALEKLVRSDYVGPVVRRIGDLLRQARETEAERARCQLQLTILSRAG
ncbi:MAG: hypothetical protein ACXVH0_03250, partial [Thermoanaerobaculia bacterium]